MHIDNSAPWDMSDEAANARDRNMMRAYLDFAGHVKVEQILFLFKKHLHHSA